MIGGGGGGRTGPTGGVPLEHPDLGSLAESFLNLAQALSEHQNGVVQIVPAVEGGDGGP